MALLQHAVAVAREYLWGFPMLALLFGTHLYFTFHLGFIQKKIPLGIRLSLTGTKNQEKDQVTPYSALATALAATIGTGNIVGISTAIAIGGPGAGILVLADRGIWDCDLLCGMLSLYKIPGAQDRQYVCRRTDVYFGSASEKKKTGSGVCCMYAAGIVWYRKQRTVILHTHGAPASDYRVAASGRNGGRGACRDYYHRGKQPDCKGVYVARPADERFLCGRLSLYYRKKQGGAAGDVSADSLIRPSARRRWRAAAPAERCFLASRQESPGDCSPMKQGLARFRWSRRRQHPPLTARRRRLCGRR